MVEFKIPAASCSLTPRVRMQDAPGKEPSSRLRRGEGEREKETPCGEQVCQRERRMLVSGEHSDWSLDQLTSAQHLQLRVEAARPSSLS